LNTGLFRRWPGQRVKPLLAGPSANPMGGLVADGVRAWASFSPSLLVHELLVVPARDGRQEHERRASHAADCRCAKMIFPVL